MTGAARTGRRGGGSKARRAVAATTVEQPPFTQPRMRFKPLRAVSDDELEAIHLASLRVLAETGIDFLADTACRQLSEAGAEVEGQRVRFAPDLVVDLVSPAPSQFTVHGIDSGRDLSLGGDWITYTSVASPPFVTGLGGDRRDGNREDYQNLIKLGHLLNTVHTFAGYPVDPLALHPSVRHLHATEIREPEGASASGL